MFRKHSTDRTPSEDTTEHYWVCGDDRGSVGLLLMHTRNERIGEIFGRSPAFAEKTAATEAGHWVFGVFQSHRDNPGSGWTCDRHGDACDLDAFATHVAEPAWQRLRAGGVTDTSVYAELEALFALEFDEVPA